MDSLNTRVTNRAARDGYRLLHGMTRRPFDRRTRGTLWAFLLLAFVLRALIPAGYMPDSDRPFALQICPDGLPAQIDEHAGHAAHGDHGSPPPGENDSHQHETLRAAHCVFATAASAGIPELHAPALTVATSQAVVVRPRQIFLHSSEYRPQQPRGPPALS
jgi:hypothetical protein